MPRPAFCLATLLLVGAAACATASSRRAAIETTTFAAPLNVELESMTRTAEGLYYRDLEVGPGASATEGRRVAVHYIGWLPDGTEIDAVLDPRPPVVFRLGAGEVIRGWELGVRGMRVGGQRQLVIPPALGYGSQGPGLIPRHSVLVFTIALVAVD